MKKSMIIYGLLGSIMLTMTGCGNAIPEMDEETKEIVVEYAAATVRKYDANRETKLLEHHKLEKEMEKIIPPEEPKAVTEEKEPEKESSTTTNNVEVIDNTQEAEVVPASLEELLELEQISVTYSGYETNDFYPEAGDEIFFVMNATEGNQLLVLKFQLQNLSSNEMNVDLLSKNIRYKIVVNGETKSALTTMLLNDMANYQEIIPAGESKEVVLVCEIPTEQAGQISTLDLMVKNADGNATISLN